MRVILLGAFAGVVLCSGAASAETFTYSSGDLGPLGVCTRAVPKGGIGGLSVAQISAACANATTAEALDTLDKADVEMRKAGLAGDERAGLVGDLPGLGVPLNAEVIVAELAALVEQRMEQEVIQSFAEQTSRQVCDHPARAQWVPRFCQIAEVLGEIGEASPWLIVRRALEQDLGDLPAHAAAALTTARVPLPALPAGLDPADLVGYGVAFDASARQVVLRGRLGRDDLALLAAVSADASWKAAVGGLRAELAAEGDRSLGVAFALELAADVVNGDSPMPRLFRLMDPEANGYYCGAKSGRCARLVKVLGLAGQYLVRVLGPLHFTGTQLRREGMVEDLQSLLSRAVKNGELAGVQETSIRRVAHLLQELVRTTERIPEADVARRPALVAQAVRHTFALTREALDGVTQQPGFPAELTAEAKRWLVQAEAAEAVAEALASGPHFDQAVLGVLLQVRASLPEVLPPAAMRVLTFATNLATARDAESVKSVLESTAASTGAWRLKRRPGLHFSVTALPGVAGGYEQAVLPSNVGAPAVYLFAPVGVELSFLGSRAFGLGVYVSVLDVGQLLSVPLNDQTDDERLERADVKVEQVFSPGLYLKAGLGDTPLVVGGGVSLAPALRNVLEGEPVEGATVVRGVAFLAVDVTLYPF